MKQFEHCLGRLSGSVQMTVNGDVLTLSITLLFSLTACPASAHLLLIILGQTYLRPVVQVFLNYVCHSGILCKVTAKCFWVGEYI